MKTFVGLITVLAFLLGMTACGNTKPEQTPESEEMTHTAAESSTADSKEEGETGQYDLEKKSVMLNSGYAMPVIGLGTWTLNDEEAENSVYAALKCGMRLIDTARYYGNEKIRTFVFFLLSEPLINPNLLRILA